MNAIGLGFVGVGLLGQSMIEQVPNVPGLRLVAIQDVNLDLAARVAESYASPWHGQHFEDLISQPAVDAVVISTPNAFHIPQAQAALRAGKTKDTQRFFGSRAIPVPGTGPTRANRFIRRLRASPIRSWTSSTRR